MYSTILFIFILCSIRVEPLLFWYEETTLPPDTENGECVFSTDGTMAAEDSTYGETDSIDPRRVSYSNSYGYQTIQNTFPQDTDVALHLNHSIGSFVRVTNVKTGSIVVVQIVGRPVVFPPWRILELSTSAFEKIADYGDGAIECDVTIL